ncbi:MAG: hypothetical protein KDD48_06930 [Bdellovibrionales bacterium]|nr:hypothetical protein [Bdellovibrionales bacterium]
MKKMLTFSMIGLILGNLLTSWFGPRFLTWWFDPPAQMGFNCTDPIRWALHRLVTVQIIGSVIGLILGLVLSFVFYKSKPQKRIFVEADQTK